MNKQLFSAIYKKVIALLLVLCFWFNSSVVYAADFKSIDDYTYYMCENINNDDNINNENELREALKTVINNSLNNSKNINIKEIVDQEWNNLKIDSQIDKEIDQAVITIKNKKNAWDKFASNWDKLQVKELLSNILEEVFTSPSLKKTLTQLSENVIQELSKKLEKVIFTSSEEAIICLNKYIEKTYSEKITESFAKNLVPNQKIEKLTYTNFDKNISVTNTETNAIIGIGIIIASQIGKQLGNQIGERVLIQLGERLLGRLGAAAVPIIGEILGGILIVTDVINNLDGALPDIEKQLKEGEFKNEIKKEIISIMDKEVINNQTMKFEIIDKISTYFLSQWHIFRNHYQDSLKLIKKVPEFDSIFAKDNDKVNNLLKLAKSEMSNNDIIKSIKNKDFERTIDLPESSYVVLDTHPINILVGYANLTEDQNKLDQAIKLELYKYLPPDKLNKSLLNDVLSLNNLDTVKQLLQANNCCYQNIQ